MPRFFFNVYDHHGIVDKEGTILPDLQTAQLQAVKLAGAVVAENAKHLGIGEAWRLEVADEIGTVLFRLDFQFSASAAVMTAGLRAYAQSTKLPSGSRGKH